MTTPEQRDPVEELRQRVEKARRVAPVGFAHDYYRPLSRALAEIEEWLDGHALSAAPDYVVQAVARELVGEGQTYTEWCTYWGTKDPNTSGEMWTCDEYDEAASMLTIVAENEADSGIAQRQVTVSRTRWQVVAGEPRG